MSVKESWREALDRIIECALCREYEGYGDTVGRATGWTTYGDGPEPCTCNPWAFKRSPLQDVILKDNETRLNIAEITTAYVEAEYYYNELDKGEKKDDAR
jgi:hypothetical protein